MTRVEIPLSIVADGDYCHKDCMWFVGDYNGYCKLFKGSCYRSSLEELDGKLVFLRCSTCRAFINRQGAVTGRDCNGEVL